MQDRLNNAERWLVDPVADVLDWLGHYDFREEPSAASTSPPSDPDDEAPACEGPSSDMAEGPYSTYIDPRFPGSNNKSWAYNNLARNPHSMGGPLLPGSHLAPEKKEGSQNTAGRTDATVSAGSLVHRPCCTSTDARAAAHDMFEEEEQEWDSRQRQSGTVGRLVIYHQHEVPREDVVLRGGGPRRHIVVAGVRDGGQAARMGVRAGDRLVSINGKKDFMRDKLSADTVRDRLQAPTSLVFLGFVGKLQAEVRLTCAEHACGFSTRQEVVQGSSNAPVRLCEERIFKAGAASIFLTAGKPPSHSSGMEEFDGTISSDRESCSIKCPMFELQRQDARVLVKRILQRLDVKAVLDKPPSMDVFTPSAIAGGVERQGIEAQHNPAKAELLLHQAV
mmetsp:Transcript_131098/g.261603  ORF Transcript_131098/g.261603 Transcript_131098/m.261603 type:complete len:392 (+) Transcript_131098:202-1377(+)|eukprot:CAMPEP_0172716018 /NCGR_PEP_ID=MMETSP1074-20121228/67879_1 /TAXON_ID=2916 /ORGANISM="Ceratium fusus, Strain PA161109" /LENGTH=391 /DNA_ID=CAMNT_0013540659 /DNA_START=98 /DNA_END=1273 /DNA_ORIENTATION=+